MGAHSPIFCCGGNIHDHMSWVCIHPYFHENNKRIPRCVQSNLAPWVCVTESAGVWYLCKHFHVGLHKATVEREKKERKKWIQKIAVIRNSTPHLCLVVAVSVAHSHTQTCTHTLTVRSLSREGQWPHTRLYKHLQLVTHWKATKTSPPPTHSHHQTESCPLTLIWPFSCSLDPHCYRGTGHSFLFFGGFGGQLHLTKSSVANSLQQDQLVEVVLGAE